MQYAVLLMAYGGPGSLDEIEPYLLDVRGGRPTPPELVAEIRARYARIGGRSPLLDITQAQARALEERLNQQSAAAGISYRVFVGMRHWQPYIREAVGRIVHDGLSQGVALCMAPHYSRLSIGAYFQKLEEAEQALVTPLKMARVASWHDHPLFIGALAEGVREAMHRFTTAEQDAVRVLFTAHSLPAAVVEQGDPYPAQLQETCRLLAARLALPAECWQFCYQSAGATSARWLGPAVEDVIAGLCDAGHKQILVAPVGFVADHVEVLYDIDVECLELARARGAHLERTASLNTAPAFVEALASIVRQAIAECQIKS